MPHYSFQNEAGDKVERFFSISKVPASIKIKGVKYVRIIDVAPEVRKEFKPYQSHAASAKIAKKLGIPVDKSGKVRIESREQERKYGKATNQEWQ